MISIVVPIYNEESLIEELFERTITAISKITDSFEIICVDDGSNDNTLNKLVSFHKQENRFKVLSLSRNFGHQRAILAGLSYAKGEYIGIMDGDLQDPPELFGKFYSKLENEFQVVYGIRKKRKESIIKKFAYWMFYRILKSWSEIDIHLDSGDFSMFTREVLNEMLSMPEQSVFLRGMRSWVGFRQTGVEYERNRREKGKTKYSIRKLLQLAANGIFSFSYVPIKFLGHLGITIILFSIIYAIYIIVKKLFYGNMPQGFTTLILVIIFFSGIQLVSIRILGEYIVRTYKETKKRQLFIIKDKFL
ncbi:MAG: glycosyltransferase family 2 protein [Bacteroidales bacterium]|nr:glycosyltransferase family 2 protein [Bacteroidales bacterium]